jgi:hypothetical protein
LTAERCVDLSGWREAKASSAPVVMLEMTVDRGWRTGDLAIVAAADLLGCGSARERLLSTFGFRKQPAFKRPALIIEHRPKRCDGCGLEIKLTATNECRFRPMRVLDQDVDADRAGVRTSIELHAISPFANQRGRPS